MAPGSAVDAPEMRVPPGAEGWALSWTLCNRPHSLRSKAEEYVLHPDPLWVRGESRSSAHVDRAGSALLTPRPSRHNPDFATLRPREQLSNQSQIRRAAVDTEDR